jgi:D-aminopeptidase
MNRRRFMGTTLGGLSLAPLAGLIREMAASPGLQKPVEDEPRKRLRELGIRIGTLEPGPHNALTDVAGVKVGQTTIIKGEGKGAARTGVTVISPHSGNVYEENLWASAFSLNGWGEMTGVAPMENTGLLRTPIFLTGTYNVGIVYGA